VLGQSPESSSKSNTTRDKLAHLGHSFKTQNSSSHPKPSNAPSQFANNNNNI